MRTYSVCIALEEKCLIGDVSESAWHELDASHILVQHSVAPVPLEAEVGEPIRKRDMNALKQKR